MDSLLKESQLKEKQGILFDKDLAYVKTKVLRPSLLGAGNLGKNVFVEFKRLLKEYQKNILSIEMNMKKFDFSNECLERLEEIEADFDAKEHFAKEKHGYVPFRATQQYSDTPIKVAV